MNKAEQYFLGSNPSFWKLENDAIEWSVVGGTIAVKEEVEALLKLLDTSGAPHSHFLMLFLASFKVEAKTIIHSFADAMDCVDDHIYGDWRMKWARFCVLMAKLSANPPEIPMWKAFICEQIFTGGNCWTPGSIENLLLNNQKLWQIEAQELDKKNARELLGHAIRVILCYQGSFEKEDLENLYRTGVQAAPAVIEEVKPEDDLAQLFYDLGEAGKDSAIVAKLAAEMYPAFAKRGKMQQSQDLPLGGYTNVSNKGSIDKLVLSELAHDDLTLSTRIVMGEAMYLKREAPPLPDQPERAIILDCGVRSWGIPSLLTTAGAMAIARLKKDVVAATVYQNDEMGELQRINFLEATDVLKQMENMSATAHPGAALEQYFERERAENEDVYLITVPEVIVDREFQEQLYHLTQDHVFYILTVSRSGEIELHYYSKFGARKMFSIIVDVAKIMADAVDKKTLDVYVKGELPIALSMVANPLRVPLKAMSRKPTGVYNGGYLDKNKYGYLLYWERNSKGAILLDRSAVAGSISYAQKVGEIIYSVIRSKEKMTLAVSYLKRSLFVDLPAEVLDSKYYWLVNSILLCISAKSIRAVSMEGVLVDEKELSILKYCHGFVRSEVDDRWYKLGFSSGIELIDQGEESTKYSVMFLDVKNRTVKRENSGLWVEFNFIEKALVFVEDVTAQGDAVRTKKNHHYYDLESDKITLSMQTIEQYTFFKMNGASVPQVVKNFQYAAISKTGHLILVSASGMPYVFHLASQLFKQQQKNWLPSQELEAREDFETVEYEKKGMLSKVSWPALDLYLDQNGFLHFLPVDNEIPEMTLCLVAGQLTGWIKDVGSFGNVKLMLNEDAGNKKKLDTVLYDYSELIASINQ